MEDITLKTILQALNEHSQRIETRIDKLDSRVDNFEQNTNYRFDRLETKFDGLRQELSDAQETLDFVSSKTLKHEKKLRQL